MSAPMRHVVMFSGGIGSWAAAKRVAERHGTADLTLLFADTLIEDEDTYRFLADAAANVGGQLVRIADGRTPWQVFHDERFLGNSRVDPCSKILKRQQCDRWLAANCEPDQTVVYVGIDFTEEHRFQRARGRMRDVGGWTVEAPLCEPPWLMKDQMLASARACGLRPSRAYDEGFPHDNCGGGCIKMGHGQAALLLRSRPAVFADWEAEEAALRVELGDVSILRDRRGGKTAPLSLKAFRERIQAGAQVDMLDLGGCGCFAGSEAA